MKAEGKTRIARLTRLTTAGVPLFLVAVLGSPGTAWACGYNFGPGIAFVPLLLFLPVVVVCLGLACLFKGKTGWRQGVRGLGLAVATVYAVSYGLLYPTGMKPDGFAGGEALFLSGVLAATILAIWFCGLAPGRRRRVAIGATVGAFVVVNLLTPRVVRFQRFEPVENPLPQAKETMRMFTGRDARLGDGRYLRFDSNRYQSGEPMPVYTRELSPAQVEISIVARRRVPRRFEPLVDLGWIEVREEMNEIAVLGVARVLEDDWVPAPDAAYWVLSNTRTGCQPEYVAEVLRRGADPNAGPSGTSVLHAAARKRCPEVVAHLLAAGADVNALDSSGQTPLHRAAFEFGTLPVLERLLASGADVGIRDRRGWTALDIARGRFGPGGSEAWRSDAPQIVGILEAATPRPAPEATDP